jgi:nitroreductase
MSEPSIDRGRLPGRWFVDLFEAVKQRYSEKRAFVKEAIPLEDLEEIVDAGRRAPSGGNLQTTEFILVTKGETIERVGDIIAKSYVKDAAAIVALIADPNTSLHHEGETMNFCVEDASATAESMLLAVCAKGYASCWIDGRLRVKGNAEKIADLLKVPREKKVQIILPIGRAKSEGKQKEKKPFDERVYYNHYLNKKRP